MTDLQLADYCVDLYSDHPADMTVFFGPATSQVCVGLKVLPDGTNIITFRGSKTALDWFRDFRAVMYNVTGLGGVELGFYQGLQQVLEMLVPHLGSGAIYITGHSLGAARGVIFGAMLILKGIRVAKVVVFGCPRPGGSGLKAIYTKVGTPIVAYLNYLDPVPEVPESIPPAFDFTRPFEPIWLNDPPVKASWFGYLLGSFIPSLKLARHNMIDCYRVGVARVTQKPA